MTIKLGSRGYRRQAKVPVVSGFGKENIYGQEKQQADLACEIDEVAEPPRQTAARLIFITEATMFLFVPVVLSLVVGGFFVFKPHQNSTKTKRDERCKGCMEHRCVLNGGGTAPCIKFDRK